MRIFWATAAAAALLAGCGTTVPMQGAQGGRTDGLGGVAAPGDGGTSPLGSGAGGNGAVGLGGSSTGSRGGGATGSAQQGGATGVGTSGGSGQQGTSGVVVPKAGESGRGFTKTQILIGVATADDYNAFAGTLGVKGVTVSGDPKKQMQAVADDINKHGGILGRKVVLVPHDYNSAQTVSNAAAANEAACVDWTQDHHVFAVALAGGIVEDTLLSCLNKADTPLIDPGAGLDYPLHYSPTYKKYPLFFNLAQMVGERYDRIAIGRLAARGFFKPWNILQGGPGTAPVKVGLLSYDDADGALQLADQRMNLAKHGITVEDSNIVRCPRALQASVSCQQNSVLKFRANGVSHIFGAGLIFVENAESQGYRPRYFFAVEPRVIAENAPPAQMNGAMGEGYIPVMDVESTEYPGDPTSATKRCNQIMKAAGQGTTDGTTLWNQQMDCDQLFFLRAALSAVGSLSSGALRAGLERLGATEPSALTWGTFLSPTEHTSATVLRDIEFRNDIQRFAYVSKTNYGD
jgi:hypothetical protein